MLHRCLPCSPFTVFYHRIPPRSFSSLVTVLACASMTRPLVHSFSPILHMALLQPEIALELRRLTGTPCGEALCRCPGFELTLSGNGTGNLPVLLLRRAIPDGLSLECCAAALRRRYRGGRLKALSLQISRDL